METYLATELFTINYLQVIWALLNKKYVSKKQAIILSAVLFSIFIISYLIRPPYVFFLLFIFYTLSAVFIVKHTSSWLLMSLTLFMINSLTIISWFFTYDLLNLLFQLTYIDLAQYQSFVLFSLIAQQILLFLLILSVKKLDKKYRISNAILHIPKSYKLQSMIALFFLVLFALIKQVAITDYFVESFFYLTFLLLTLSLIIYSTAYLYSKYYQQQVEKDALFKQYDQEMEKITTSDEFRHDYRNILLSLADYIEQDKAEEALNYIASITSYSQNILADDPYAALSNLRISSAQGLLVYLIESCKKEKITLHLKMPDVIHESDLSIHLIDFLHCLSLLLKYAVNESAQKETKVLYIVIQKKYTQLFIKIKNTAQVLSLPVKKSKKEFKELGLDPVKKIVHQYEHTDFLVQSNNKEFSLFLIIPLSTSLE